MKNILIIHTGGTISMQENEQTGTVDSTGTHPLSGMGRNYHSIANVEEVTIFDLPSPSITPTHMLELANKIIEVLPNYDGIVVTHGTDTMEESAYFLDLVLDTEKPIVITGAMRSSNELGSDALPNLVSSLRVAASDIAMNKGVLVVMNEEIHTAKHVIKTSSTDIATFKSPAFGPLGFVTKQGIHFERVQLKEVSHSIKRIDSNVILLTAYSGMDEQLIEAIHNLNPDGIVIEAFGQGNLPEKIVNVLEKIIENNIPVIIVSRSQKGMIHPSYSYLGGGSQLKDIGCIFVPGLTGPKARLKLMICLQQTRNLAELSSFMNK